MRKLCIMLHSILHIIFLYNVFKIIIFIYSYFILILKFFNFKVSFYNIFIFFEIIFIRIHFSLIFSNN